MLYNKHNITDLDLGKYKRFVAIGCSFTRWIWPTWSDLISLEMPDAHYVNCARGGAGNQYITTMLGLLSRQHNFGPETLVGIMWSTFCREDRYVYENPRPNIGKPRGWHTPGNLLVSKPDDPFVDVEMLEPFHYLIRDTSIISTANEWLKIADFDTLNISALDLEAQIPHANGTTTIVGREPEDKLIKNILDLHKDLDNDFVGYLYRQGDSQPEMHVYPTPQGMFTDYHPKCEHYCNLLDQWGIPISSDTREFASRVTQKINEVTDPDWIEKWPYSAHPTSDDEMTFYEYHFINKTGHRPFINI